MKKRHVFSTPSVAIAEGVLRTARQLGIGSGCICIEARSDVEIKRVDEDRLNVSMDFIPAAWHGTLLGAVAGVGAGLIGLFVPYFGLSLGAVAALGVVGALVGTWASVLIGSALPDEVRRTFHDEIEAGQVLVVIDAEPEELAGIEPALAAAGGVRLPFESNTALA